MRPEPEQAPPTVDHKPHAAFFRQSGWLMISAVVAGGLAYGVHLLAKADSVSKAQYAAFGTLLMVVACLPTLPLQMVLTQQTALALARGQLRQLAGTIRFIWLCTFILWLAGAVVVFIFRDRIISGWHLPDAGCLWVTVFVVLVSLWMPMFLGVLQGRQDFFWMGWATILASVGRLGGAVFLVLVLGMAAAGMMAGALLGVGFATLITVWRSRDLWSGPAAAFDRKSLARQVLPLIFGFGACQFLFTSDTMFAKAYFSDDQMGPYVAAGTLSRGLLWLVMPLAAVMFPKLVHSSVRREKSNLFGLVVLGTAALSLCGALGLWLLGPIAIKIIYKSSYLGATSLIPWYAGAMVPLAMANVLVNDLLARSRFAVVPFMVMLAVAYGFTLPWMLNHFPGRMQVALQTLAVFNLLLFGVCAWFTWGPRGKSQAGHAE
jgi:O-antigen/teichoic acid export membrane protein